MIKVVLSRKDAIFLLELINESIHCNTGDNLNALVARLNELIPFDYAVTGIAKFGRKGKVQEYNLVNVNYPVEWLELYVTRGYHLVDPVVVRNFNTFDIQYWAETYKVHKPPREFVLCAEDFGLRSGFTHGMREFKQDEGSLFSIAGKKIMNDLRTRTIVEYIVPHFHLALSRIIAGRRRQADIRLSNREKEVLRWIQAGKTSWEISVILGISERTIKFHVSNIILKMDVVNRTQAAATAVQLGLIDVD
jgi:DNA-binding CsgD family transcriptional regulator